MRVLIAGAAFAAVAAACSSESGGTASGPGGGIDAGADAATDAGADAAVEAIDAGPWPDVPAAPKPAVAAAGLAQPCGVAPGPQGVVYVAEQGGGRVLGVPTDGQDAAVPAVVVAGLADPRQIAVAGDDAFVTEPAAGDVVRVRKGAATALATGQASPGALRADGAWVFFVAEGKASADGALRRVPVEGGAVEDLATGLAAPRGLAVTSSRVYFAEAGSSQVGWVPIAGGAPPVRVADTAGSPQDVAADEPQAEVFWSSPGKKGGGWIHRANLDLGAGATVAFSPPGPGRLWLGPTHVVWATAYSITRAPRAGGPYEDLAVQTSPCGLAVAGGAIVWTEPATGRVLRIAAP